MQEGSSKDGVPREDTGAGSAKAGAEGDAEGAGQGKDTCKGNLPAGPVEENNSDIGIGRPLLVHCWKPNQAEACTKEERDGRGGAEHGGECKLGMHARNIDEWRCEDNAMHQGAAAKSGQKIITKGTFPEHLPGYPI